MPGAEVKLVRELDPQNLAERSGGILVSENDVPGRINYKRGYIVWAGFPSQPKGVYVATPFLEVETPKPHGTTLTYDAAVLTKNSVMIVRASLSNDTISIITFKQGDFLESQIPVSEASRVLVKAAGLVDEASRRKISPIPSFT